MRKHSVVALADNHLLTPSHPAQKPALASPAFPVPDSNAHSTASSCWMNGFGISSIPAKGTTQGFEISARADPRNCAPCCTKGS
eukprot:1153767-Pelagomonas_calceolata.AAC.10